MRILLALLVLALPASLAAQPPVTPGAVLFFDHDGVNVASWDLRVDTGAWVKIAPVKGPQVGTTTPAVFTYSVPFPASTPGAHTVTVRACNIAGCTESDPFAYTLVLVPSKPANLRAGAAQ